MPGRSPTGRVPRRHAAAHGHRTPRPAERRREPRAPTHRTQRPFPGRGWPRPQSVLRSLREGISVGHGDDYGPRLDGEAIELTGLAPGRYLLVHHANPDRSLAESDHTNNAASVLITLAWPRATARAPRIAVIARCPRSERCPPRA